MTKAIYQALATVSVTFGIISDGMHYGWSSPVLPILLSDKSPFEFHPRQIVWIEVWLLLGVLAGVPIADVAVKRYGGRKPILAANGLSVTAWIVIALAGTIKLVYLARFLAGLAARVASVGASLYIAEISDKRSRQWLNSVINVMMLLGVVIVYILVPLLPILTSSLIGVAFLLLQMVSFPCTPEPTRDSAEAQVLEEPLREGERITFGEFIKEENSLKTLLIVMCVSCWQQLAGFGVVVMNLHAILTDAHCEMNTDTVAVIFITEYMSSGSLKQFLKRTKRNVKRLPLQAWRRWCKQILSALSYLHSCSPPIIHGNLTCDTIFIQHNGLVKIGSVAPDSINHHVKTCPENIKNMHFFAPEYGASASLTPALDIYSFGMCALEMAALEIQGNGDSGNIVTEENISKTIDSLEDEQQKDFIKRCLHSEPQERPTARELLFHPLLFEVHSLKLLAAHCLAKNTANISETITDELMQRIYSPDVIVAVINHLDKPATQIKMSDVQGAEKLEKFVEDVKNGIYPLTAFGAKQPPPARSRAISPEMAESVKSVTPEPLDTETRKIVNMLCDVKSIEDSCELAMTILLRMDDKMNRQLTCIISEAETPTPTALAQELVHYGFINETMSHLIIVIFVIKLPNK
ncbi:hypothetical protein PPYR_11275 [Photinus pyralis]|uniref:Protein kinase domain-containing protein n=1 Tax=Photinus pyralis TaxID=7054 RepID=A0A5N4AAT0_PHOPY|nr:hypothetical protein PPYR_11275 [Photinus pyralis]